ncbi:MAG: hypothetical protein ONB16_04235 [candidate division KSB1 bacterium]|nr:hypothetical protein [candidate division KSB1 bacterium]MDZ7317958.1 hypothetical protein [candidate division KSB1 bacterium]MDZ7342148.1 hypothetical protein [candidate division KSB1 bacterium]
MPKKIPPILTGQHWRDDPFTENCQPQTPQLFCLTKTTQGSEYDQSSCAIS